MHYLIQLALGPNLKGSALIVLMNTLSGVLLLLFLSHLRVLSANIQVVEIGTLLYLLVLTLIIGLLTAVSEYLIGRMVARTESRLLKGMAGYVMSCSLAEVQANGRESVDVIFRESGVISKQMGLFLKSGKDLILLLFLFVYALSVSPIVTVLTIGGGLLYEFVSKHFKRRIRSEWGSGRAHQVRLLSRLRLIYDGFKELSLSAHVGRRFYEKEIRHNSEAICKAQGRIAFYEALLINTAQSVILGFAVIGGYFVICFGLITLAEVASLLIVFLLARGKVVSALRVYVRRDELFVAQKHVESLGIELGQIDNYEVKAYGPLVEDVHCLRFDGVFFQYPQGNESAPFRVGPINASFRRGEIVFIHGRNGCGKSTLAKLICGLYAPSGGRVECDGRVVHDSARRGYQQLFGAVFSDYCLFHPEFYADDASLNTGFLELQKRLGLGGDLLAMNDLQSAGLSTGQRKRVALALALLEEKPVYIFDEWAADQDTGFRKVFYEGLLQELAARDKLIFVISHHEDYFHVADRIFKVEEGTVCECPAHAL